MLAARTGQKADASVRLVNTDMDSILTLRSVVKVWQHIVYVRY
jgi:hypothetical protein